MALSSPEVEKKIVKMVMNHHLELLELKMANKTIKNEVGQKPK